MRLFIAIDIPKEVKEKIRTSFLYTKDSLEFARFTEPENLHITLVFLGEMPESQLNTVKAVMDKTAKPYSVHQLEIKNAVIGPDENQARMIWLKLSDDSQKYLEEISNNLKKELRAKNISFDNDHATLNGHITLARFDSGWRNKFEGKNEKTREEDAAKIKNVLPESFEESFAVSRITLFSSLEKNGQRIYEPLFESDFKG